MGPYPPQFSWILMLSVRLDVVGIMSHLGNNWIFAQGQPRFATRDDFEPKGFQNHASNSNDVTWWHDDMAANKGQGDISPANRMTSAGQNRTGMTSADCTTCQDLINISEDGFVSLLTDSGSTKNDLRLPIDDQMLTQIRLFWRGERSDCDCDVCNGRGANMYPEGYCSKCSIGFLCPWIIDTVRFYVATVVVDPEKQQVPDRREDIASRMNKLERAGWKKSREAAQVPKQTNRNFSQSCFKKLKI
eukprot:Gb_12534 [translate_table: standard]